MKHILVLAPFILSFGACAKPDEAATADTTAPAMPPATAAQRAAESKQASASYKHRLRAAKTVMANARGLCNFSEDREDLVVECGSVIGDSQQLAFANAVADADAVLTGRARAIYFYQPGGEKFAKADQLYGVRLTR